MTFLTRLAARILSRRARAATQSRALSQRELERETTANMRSYLERTGKLRGQG